MITPDAIRDVKEWIANNLDDPIARTVALLLIERDKNAMTLNMSLSVAAIADPETMGKLFGNLVRTLSPEDAEAAAYQLLNRLDEAANSEDS
jgi:hypothetical protein